MRNSNAENHPFAFDNPAEPKITLKFSQTEQNLNTVIFSRPMDTNLNKNSETDFISTLLDDGTIIYI